MLIQDIKLSEAECEVVSLQRGGNTIGFAGNHKSQTKGVATSRHCPGNKSTHNTWKYFLTSQKWDESLLWDTLWDDASKWQTDEIQNLCLCVIAPCLPLTCT